ncbi:MAG: hypothetical protein LDL41_26515 [Coleofasciculus sp. S288]|nr:hypothetical protein [Coleofasciculus sp. S288]
MRGDRKFLVDENPSPLLPSALCPLPYFQVRPHHRFLIVNHLSHLDFLEEQIALFDAQIAQHISQYPVVEPDEPTTPPDANKPSCSS